MDSVYYCVLNFNQGTLKECNEIVKLNHCISAGKFVVRLLKFVSILLEK